jgi:uncharacterized membrane protein (UPF0127 family)
MDDDRKCLGIFLAIIAIIILFLAISILNEQAVEHKVYASFFSKTTYKTVICYIANTEIDIETRLMNLTNLSPDNGVFLKYDTPRNITVQLTNIQIPLDIIFADSDRTVINIEKAGVGSSSYHSISDAQYVVVSNQGLLELHKIGVGAEIIYEYR